ncbi:MAG: trigger factor [Saprospiraceae bacterium]|nr:trigger factor [Saprospiraceae bacterium]
MQVLRKDTDPLNITLTFAFEPSDYASTFEKELNTYKNKAQLKGFRKGMTPISVIKKMYGKSVLVDVINKLVQDSLFNYLDEHKINYLGQPLPNTDESTMLNLNVNDLQPLTFSFDLGLAPEFEVQGVSASDQYNLYDVQIAEDTIEKEIDAARRRAGKMIHPEDKIEVMDMLKVDASELENGVIKEGGWKTEFTILVDAVKDADVQKELLQKKKGDSFVFDIYKLEDKDEKFVNSYLLKKTPEETQETGNMFEGVITDVQRIDLAELNEEFFVQFGEESVKDEESLRNYFRDDLKSYYNQQAKQYMYREIMDVLMDNNDIPLPDSYMKKYLVESNENITQEQVEQEYDAFAKNLRWNLQKAKLAKTYELSVNEEEIKRKLSNKLFSFMQQYGQFDYNHFGQTLDRLLTDKEQVSQAHEEILADKIFEQVDNVIQKNMISITMEAFAEKVSELNKRVNNS